MLIHYSVPEGTEDSLVLGKAHYSWRIASIRFTRMLTSHGVDTRLIKAPHIYDSRISARQFTEDSPPLHVIFRPFDQIRLLKCGYNVGAIVWEFDGLTGDDGLPDRHDTHPFHNQVRMLSCLDEVWTASTYSKRVFDAAGIRNVHVIPAPIAVPTSVGTEKSLRSLRFISSNTLDISHMRSADSSLLANRNTTRPLYEQPVVQDLASRKIYLSILNPGDERKNLDAMLKGFAGFSKKHPDCVLILKCTIDNVRTTLEIVQRDTIRPKLRDTTSIASPNIVLISASLDEQQLAELYSIADFYLCTSRCEGQNLPLLEAMAHGVVPVSTDNTAMGDYIDVANAFVIESRKAQVDNGNATAHQQRPLHWFDANAYDTLRALTASAAADRATLAAKSAASRQTVAARFGFQSVFDKASERIATIRSLFERGWQPDV